MNQSPSSTDTHDTTLQGDAIPALAATRSKGSRTGAIVVFGAFMVAVLGASAYVVHQKFGKPAEPKPSDQAAKLASDAGPKLVLPAAETERIARTSSSPAALPEPPIANDTPEAVLARSRQRVPGVEGAAGDPAPIPVVRDGAGRSTNGKPSIPPIDAPVFAARGQTVSYAPAPASDQRSARLREIDREAADGERRLQQQLASIEKMRANVEAQMAQANAGGGLQAASSLLGGAGPASPEAAASAPNTSLLGGMEKSLTPRVQAQAPFNRSLTVPKGTIFQCALKTRVVTATSGFVSCQVQRDVYSHDGRVVLVERGSHLDGEYRMVTVRPGLTRIPVVWTRILTPEAISVDLESPAVGPIGESGLGGYVDNRWPERIGAALLISLIDDSLKAALKGSSDGQQGTVVLSGTADQTSTLAETVLQTTVNIPPLMYQNQGSIAGVYVARDIDFSRVYRLVPAPNQAQARK